MAPSDCVHPPTEQLRAFFLGRSNDADTADIEAHIADCPNCCEVLVGLTELDAFQARLLAVGRRPAAPKRPLVLPVIEGYQVLGEVGKGGMGVVYKARDLRLKRLVALKMILQGDFADEQQR